VTGSSKLIVGWREWVVLPDLGSARVKAKVDTGARTSSIHAWNIEPATRDGAPWVTFEIHPLQDDNAYKIACAAPVHDERLVKSSTGHVQKRYVIRTTLSLGGRAWPVELTLARRDEMGFRMLIGRTALKGRALVNPARSFLCKDEDVEKLQTQSSKGPK
jgi:hypothetical protein